MTDVTILTNVTDVTIGSQSVELDITAQSTTLSTGTGVVQVAAYTMTAYLGSAFTGGTGGFGRSLVHSSSIDSNAIIRLNQRFLEPDEFTLSTTVETNDTITISTLVENSDRVAIWT